MTSGIWRVMCTLVMACVLVFAMLVGFTPSALAVTLQTESFNSGDPEGWSANWTTDNAASPPGNRDLMTGTSTVSNNTGPGTAPTGSFLYYESSNGTGTVRHLTHATGFDAGQYLLTVDFNYHMFGADMGTLNFQVNDGGGWTTVWTQTGDQGDTWFPVSVDLDGLGYNSGTIDLRFQFNMGAGFASDMTIDEIVIDGVTRCTPSSGPVTVTSGAVAGAPTVNVCGLYNGNGIASGSISNIKVTSQDDVTTYYNGAASCTAVPVTTAAGALIDWPAGPDAPLKIEFTAADGNSCGDSIGSGNFTFTACTPTVGSFDVIDGSILSGTTTDVTTALDVDAAYTLTNVKVYEVTGGGADIDELHEFEYGGLTGWGSTWTATLSDGSTPQNDPPDNGDLFTGTFTRSEGTGPSAIPHADFVYYEASVGATTATRYLVHSTSYDSANNHISVDFKYNMNGADIGTLALQAQNPNCNGGAWTDEWSLSGNQGDVWTDVSVDLYNGSGASACAYNNGNTQLRFAFTHSGTGPQGDIAIDEVRIQGPRGTGALLFDGTEAQAQVAKTDGSGGFPVWPEGTVKIEITGADDCGGALSGFGFGSFQADYVLPTVDSFNLPLTALSPVPVYSFTASDNIQVAGYLISQSATKPAANDPGWTSSKPLNIVTGTTGNTTFYAWAKDGAGNVSDYVDGVTNQTVDIQPDITAPTITQFTLPVSSFSPIAVSNFSASDDSGVVAGYMITESAVAPLAGDAGWLASPPTSIVTASTGSTNFYAWTKDSVGNVSTSMMATVDVLVDVNPPTVSFVLPATHNALTVPITTFAASDLTGGAAVNTGVAAYMITTSATPPLAGDAGWTGVPPVNVTVADETPHTFYAWAKDNSDNVSAGVSQTVTVTLPVSCVFDMDPNGTLIQTENWVSMTAPNPWAWDTVFTELPDASVQTTLNNGSGDLSVGGYIITAAGGTGSTPNGSRADYPVFFPNGTEGQWCIWIRAMDQSGNGGGDSNFWGVDGTYVGAMTQYSDNQWAWANGIQNGANCTNITVNGQDEYPAGSGTWGQWHTLNLWPREQGQKNDMFYLIRSTSTNALGAFPNATPSGGRYDDVVTVLPQTPYTEIDPTCVDSGGGGAPGGGGGSGYITIADGQSITGSPIDTETMFETDLGTPLEYRALGEQTDGFEHQNVDPKWFHSNVGNEPLLVDTVPMVEGQGMFKLAGSGTDIWNNNDQFAYHYQPNVTGDFTIDVEVKALVDKQTNTTSQQNASAKAGIMVRQSLGTNSSNVMMLVTSDNGTRLQRRQTNGGTTAYVNTTNNGVDEQNFMDLAGDQSVWLRLRRTGSLFEGFHSIDNGQTWVSLGTTTVNMTGAVNVGLAVTSHNTGRDSIGYFDNFLFMPAGLSGMSESWTSTATALDTSQPTTWASGAYGLAVRDTGSGEYAANTFDYDPCIDTTPSSLSVHSGATVGGSAVSLANLFDHTGNVGGFTYEIDGNAVNNPWNSFSVVGAGSTGTVVLTVHGTDPDCGGSFVSDSASININNTCSDPTPSTLTILTGQVVGGPNVDLTQLYSSTGNVADGGLTFKVNGVVIGDPTKWDSRQFGAEAADAVSFEVSGIDPDCGNGVTAVNTLLVDNTCTRNLPSISFDQDVNYVGAGRAVPYQVTIRNEDSFNCGPSTYNIDILSDSNGSDFVPSYFNPAGSNLGIVLQGHETAVIELAVEATAGAVEWNNNVTTLEITSSNPVHNTPKTQGAVTTHVFLVSPITHNSVTTGSTKWGGNWGTSQGGSKYGNFDCLTCHDKGGPNIKWMRGSIATPDGSNWGISGSNSLPVLFKDARDVNDITAEGGNPITDVYWGHDDPNDNGSGRATSDRVCEVCHSATMHHRYDTNTDPDGAGPLSPQTIVANESHFPGRDCTDCHRHSLGFTADCTGCHGDPPLEATLGGPNGLADIPAPTGSVTPGTHYKHTVVLGFPCEYCHNGWRNVGEMPKEVAGKQDINHLFNVFFDLGMTDPTKDNGHYTGQDGVSYEGTVIAPGAGTMTCENIYCHGGTESMGGSNPQWNGNIACNSCHGTSATNTPPGYSHTTHVGKMKLACTVCHYTGGQDAGYNGHVNGRVNLEMNTPSWQGLTPMYDPTPGDGGIGAVTVYNSNPDGSDMPPSSQYGSCLNVACHYGNETPPWNNNDQPATCTTCHNDGNDTGTLAEAAPTSGWHEEHVHPTPGTISETMITSFVSGCESCHGGGANTGEHAGHVNLGVDLGGGMTYSETTNTCTSQCHDLKGIDTKGTASPADDTPINIQWSVHNTNYTLACDACHAAPYLGPTVVDPDNEGIGLGTSDYGSHLRTSNGQVLNQATDWTTQCRYCHPYHADEGQASYAEVPLPDAAWDQLGDGTDMAERLGIQFSVTGAIHLGGAGTSGNTEAEICWNCHDANSISEWGTNTQAATGSMSYNYGSVTTSNWTTAVWTSGTAQFSYKTAAIQSTHAASTADGAVSGVDPVASIRCTYCHDVHDRNKAVIDPATGATESFTGAPYLRGSWLGNPYKEDGAPQAGTNYTNFGTDWYGQVPRGSSEPNQLMGGYWIDQNSGDPINGLTYDDFGGICQICHGTDINTLNQYGAQGAGWVSGLNGHANSVQGGAGGGGQAARNIYTATDRGGGATNNYNGNMGYWNFREPGDGGGGIRGGDGDSYTITPGVDGYGNEPCANDGGNCNGATYISGWDDLRAFDVSGATLDNNYHTFSCSKCHNPHASRLPKLMITNCLDTKQNQWDNNIQLGAVGTATVLSNTSASNWTTAQNCHRLAGNDPIDGNDAAGQGSGWNLVTPWTDGDGNYSTTGDKAQDNSGTW